MGNGAKGDILFHEREYPPLNPPRERFRLAVSGLNNLYAFGMQLPARGVAAVSVAIRFDFRLLSAAAAPACADGVVSGGQKPARPLRGSAAPPCARWPPSSVASGGGVVSRQPPLSSSRSGGASAQPPSPPPSPPASLCAGNQGRGACSSGLWPPRRCGGAPLRSSPAPRFWPRGGAILFSLRRVWGLRRLRAALEVYRTARAAQSGAVYMASP